LGVDSTKPAPVVLVLIFHLVVLGSHWWPNLNPTANLLRGLPERRAKWRIRVELHSIKVEFGHRKSSSLKEALVPKLLHHCFQQIQWNEDSNSFLHQICSQICHKKRLFIEQVNTSLSLPPCSYYSSDRELGCFCLFIYFPNWSRNFLSLHLCVIFGQFITVSFLANVVIIINISKW
jgi:hypothetical protein